MPKVNIRVQKHASSDKHHIIIATTIHGKVYAMTYSGIVSDRQARTLWRTERKQFKPYNEAIGAYTK